MRGLIALLMLLGLSGTSAIAFPQCDAALPCKKIRIFNNSPGPLYVIIESGERPVDEWLQAQFNVQPNEPDRKYESSQVIRVYINGAQGIPPQGSAEITVPFYSRLSPGTDGTQANQFIDWWNGGRIYFYDDTLQILKNYTLDSVQTIANPVTPGPCVGPVKRSCNAQPAIFFRPHADPRGVGLPATDRSQLMEFTFADAITAKGKPYTINLNGVGYNISSVDQVYLPVAMEALTEPAGQVQYIGTVMPLGTVSDPASANSFRGRLAQFLRDFPGWPVYNYSADPFVVPPPPDRPRLPGAYNIFASSTNKDLTAPGPTIQKMIDLYNTCKSSTAGICNNYNQVINLFNRNYEEYLKLGACAPPIPPAQFENEILRRIYGWVPFQGTCGVKANDLLDTAKKLGLDFNKFQENVYTKQLQYSKWDGGTSFVFNPYVKLIHGLNYLNMAAYAYSVDDAIGFQSYPGVGLIITYAGDTGLDNKTPLDRTKRVVVSLGVEHQGVPEWDSVGFCSNDTSKNVDPLFPSFTFYPAGYPCTFTAKDLKGAKYQFVIQSGPPNLALDTSKCSTLPNPTWCGFVQVVTQDSETNFINTRTIDPGPPPSTHDFNANGKSDIVWRNSNGQVALWMLDGGLLSSTLLLSSSKDNSWSLVGQRDFDRDGKADVLWLDTAGNLERWFLNGTGTGPNVLSTQQFGTVGPQWHVVGTGDFNNDGFGDVLWQDTNGALAVWLMNKTTHLVASAVLGTVPAPWSIAGVAHFNTDANIPGRSDILWRNTATGEVAIWFMNGISVVSSALVGTAPLNWSIVGTGDFDGDGFGDILWRDTSGTVAIWLMKGNQVAQSAVLGVVPTGWSAVLTGDYNFDGKSDILWRHSNGDTALWFMNGAQVASTANLGNVATSWTVQAANAE
ncbi:MAG: FG-GAP-like repeat-containing protein [Xanthobacteraceae bacterium]